VMESSRTSPWPRGASRTHFKVLGLGLGLKSLALASEALSSSSPWPRLACPRMSLYYIQYRYWTITIILVDLKSRKQRLTYKHGSAMQSVKGVLAGKHERNPQFHFLTAQKLLTRSCWNLAELIMSLRSISMPNLV